MNADPRPATRRRIAAFYVLALGISWSVWAPWIASGRAGGSEPSWRALHLVGSLGPCLAALLVIGWSGGRARLRELAGGTLTAPAVRVALIWSLLFPTIAFVASVLTMALMNGTTPRWDRIGVVSDYPALGRIGYIAASFFFYGIGEEVGWRGFLYPALRRPRRRILTAALLVVPFWALLAPAALLRDRELSRDGARRRGRLAAVAGERERPHRLAHRSRERIRCCRRPSFTPSWTSSSSPTSASRFSRPWERS